jgi:Flp pilus assembly protein TadD
VDVDAAARREALARRLLGGRAQTPSARPAAPSGRPLGNASSANVSRRPDAIEALRRRYQDRVSAARTAQARKYVTNGEAALAAGDAVAAANAFRVALTLSPDDEELGARAREAQGKADELLSETYARQGAYEEKNGQWPEASRSWTRVASVRKHDAHANERAANAIAKAGGDMHGGARFALRACELEPQNAHYRVTLANVYLAAGLTLNARRELETAAQLAPHDGTIQAMMKRLGKSA